jgi:hypothetical protein
MQSQLQPRPETMLNIPRNSGASSGPGVEPIGGPVEWLLGGDWPPLTAGGGSKAWVGYWEFMAAFGVRSSSLLGSILVGL